MKCPGQDLRYWKFGDIYEIACPQCGALIEFWKDDVRRKCKKCGCRVVNPKLDFGCAAYCRYAEQCVGGLPRDILDRRSVPLKDRLAVEVRNFWRGDLKRLSRVTQISRYAEELVRFEGGDPNIVIAAGLLLDTWFSESHRQGDDGPAAAREILNRLGVDTEVIEEICDILTGILNRQNCEEYNDTLNFRIVSDAHWLVEGKEIFCGKPLDEVEKNINRIFLTESGRRIARDSFTKK